MKVGRYIGFIVLVMVFGSAILGMLIRRKLPESHLSDETRSVVTLAKIGTRCAPPVNLAILCTFPELQARRLSTNSAIRVSNTRLKRGRQKTWPVCSVKPMLIRVNQGL
jgi:hypothetical protein